MNALPTPAIERVLVGYGSESGTARALAHRLGAHPRLMPWAPQVLPLNEIDPAGLGHGDLLLAVSSSFGDGEPPANAEQFHETLREGPALPGLRYAVFGIGDTGYPRFCGYTKALDEILQQQRAQPIINRVDADACHGAFFERWLPVLDAVLDGDAAAGHALNLQVTAYGEDAAFAAGIIERRRLNTGSLGAPAWHLQLDLRGSGIAYRAGDTLHVLPHNDLALLDALARWYGQPEAASLLADRELRLLGKPLLRELARLSASDALKTLLKSSQRSALEAYLHGLDLLDVLMDHATPDTVPLQRLVDVLPRVLPRAYSIASHTCEDTVDLCVREVVYPNRGRTRHGTATGSLLYGDGQIQVYCRSNPGFHLPADSAAPLLMVGTGTGIAPLRGLLQEIHAGVPRESHLLFGERQRQHDYLYGEELDRWHACGTLHSLRTAFSRDTPDRHYVQHALQQNAEHTARLLERGAHLYICGNKANLESALRAELERLAPGSWTELQAQGRLHCELY